MEINRRFFWIVGALVVALVAGLVYLIIQDTVEFVQRGDPIAKRVEMAESVISGYEGGKKSWEIDADYIWAGENKYIFNVESLNRGRLFNSDGKLVLDKILAESVRVNSKNKVLVATQNVVATFVKSANSSDPNPVQVEAGSLKYFSYWKKATLSDVVLRRGNAALHAKEIELDIDSKRITVLPPFRLDAGRYTVSANMMVIDVDKEYAELKDNILLYRPAEEGPFKTTVDEREASIRAQDSFLEAGYLRYQDLSGDKARITIRKNIRVFQKDKSISAERGEYVRGKEWFFLAGSVKIEADDLAWMVRSEKRRSFKNKKIQDALHNVVTVTCDNLRFEKKERKLILSGNVVVKQAEKIVKCDRLTWLDKERLIILEGNVFVQKEKDDTISTDKLTMDIDSESFWTGKGAVIEFFVD